MEPMEGASTMERVLLMRAAQRKVPINGSLELLPLCNMNCDMCYIRLSREEMERQGQLRVADEWLEMARQMQKAGVLFLMLTGGEPLLFPDFRELYLELKKLGMILTLNTNGTLIDEDWAKFFGEHKPRRINITLYGSDEKSYRELCHYPGGFEKAVNGIRLLRQYGVDVKVNGSLVKANRDDAEKITVIARELDAAVNIDTYMYPATRERERPFDQQARLNPQEAAQARVKLNKGKLSPEEFRNYAAKMVYAADHTPPGEEVPGHVMCQAGRSSFTINWQGEMRPCVMLPSPSVPVFETGFDEAWKAIVAETEKITLSPKCSQCNLRQVCQTCAACALLEGGSYDAVPDYMCRYTHHTLDCLREELAAEGVLNTASVPDN